MKEIIKGKRYWWYINNHEKKKKTGLFTGSFDENNGNVILMTKNGETWSIPIKDLKEVKK
jgi:hypothetical protein